MCFGGAPKPPKPPEQPQVEIQLDAAGQQGNEAERRRRRAQSGYQSTFMSSTGGVLGPANVGKQQLGA